MQPHEPLPRPAIGGVFRYAMPLRWGDLDALNHVNNTLYFRYVEEARVQLLARAGIILPSSKIGLLAHASCDFLKPLRYPAIIVVSLVLTHIGRTSMTLDVRIERQDEPGVVYAKGKNIMVGAEAASGRPSPWTAAELSQLASCFENNLHLLEGLN